MRLPLYHEEAELDGWRYERPVFQLFKSKPSLRVRLYILLLWLLRSE